jgi:transposase-like protein
MSKRPAQVFADARSQGAHDSAIAGRIVAAATQAVTTDQMIARAEVRCCPHCSEPAPTRWGKSHRGRQRWQCKGCCRTFSATTGTIFAGLREPDKVDAVLDDMLALVPSSCRKLGVALGLDKMTVWSWRRKLSERFAIDSADRGAEQRAEPVAVARTSVRESRKASREWVDHARDPVLFPEPDRLRWVDYRRLGLPLPQPTARYRIAIEACVAATGACWAAALPYESPMLVPSADANDTPADISNARSALEPSERFEREGALPFPAAGLEQGGPRSQCSIVELLIAELELFLRPFRGPATKHLRGYVAWFVARQRGGELRHGKSVRRLLFGSRPTLDPDIAGRHAA